MKTLIAVMIIAAVFMAYAGENGKNLFFSKCSQCHGTSVPLKIKQNKNAWLSTIKKMEKFGLEASSDEENQIADFLTGQK